MQQGQTVAVNTVVARLETDKAAGTSAAPPPPAAAVPSPVSASPAAPAAPSRPAAESPARPATPAAPAAVRTAPSPASAPQTTEERLRQKSTPLVRKIAAEHGIDIAGVPGSGHAGRVTKNDILGFIETTPPAVVARPLAAEPPSRRATEVASAAEAWPGDRVEPWSRIRKLTAEHMVMSRRVSAHVQTLFEIDYTRVSQIRARRRQEYAERGVNLTYLAFIAKAVAENLRRHAGLNAAVGAEVTIYRQEVNLGIAVALEWGLIVPVIKRADELSLMGLARAINDLGELVKLSDTRPFDEEERSIVRGMIESPFYAAGNLLDKKEFLG